MSSSWLAKEAFDEAEKATEDCDNTDADEEEVPAEGEEEADENGEEAEDEEVAADEEDAPAEDEEAETPEAEEEDVATDEDEDEEEAPATTGKVNADSVDRIVRQRIKLGMIGRTLNLDGLEDMSPIKAKKTIIKAVRPSVRLDGKSPAYIQAMFDLACEEVKANSKKDTSYQKKQMFNNDGRNAKKATVGSANAARQRMIDRQHKNKEEK